MRLTLVIEVIAKGAYDEEKSQLWRELTEEQRLERIVGLEMFTRQLILRELDEGAEVAVNVRLEEVVK